MVQKGDCEMKIYKRTIFRLFFFIEVAIFVGVYIFGGNGMQYSHRLECENEELFAEVSALKKEVGQIEQQIVHWESDDFYKEKVAREKLQMARKNDQIYFVQ